MIELIEATKRYPGGVSALRGVSLTIERGELVGIVGPSGSGKSTMLHLIGTLDRPSSGTVRIDGYDVAALLALAEGGYGVQVVDGSTTRIVAVRTGLFADGKVEISGNGLRAGMKVAVPS